MLSKFLALFHKQDDGIKTTPFTSREQKEAASDSSINNSELHSRDFSGSEPWQINFDNIRNMLKDFSKRIESIKNDPQEAYLINTEISLRLLAVLEQMARLTETNTSHLEKLNRKEDANNLKTEKNDKKRRAREVLAVLEQNGALTYNELRILLKPPISYKRVTALIAEMSRDGIEFKKQGRPVRVSLADTPKVE